MALKEIFINEFIKPCPILKIFYEAEDRASYLVTVTTAQGAEVLRFLQVFPSGQESACLQTEERLLQVFPRKSITRTNNAQGVSYLFIDAAEGEFLQWEALLEQPLQARLEAVLQIGRSLEALAQKEIFPGPFSPNTLLQTPEGAILFWDFSAPHSSEAATATLATLLSQAIAGKPIEKDDRLLQTALALQNRLSAQDIKDLLQILSADNADLQLLLLAAESLLELPDCATADTLQPSDPLLTAANFLQENPLWKYVRKDRNGQKRLTVSLIGATELTTAFLDTVLPCAQMLDTQLEIHIVAEDAADFCDAYLKKAPLLAQTAHITHIPPRADRTYTLNRSLTGKDRRGVAVPFARLTFENAAAVTAGKLRRMGAGCVLLLAPLTEQMRAELMTFTCNARRPLLIGLQGELPEDLHPYVRLASIAQVEESDNTQIYQKAFALHTFYSKDYNQRITRKQILKDFEKRYNRDSSIRSALSIPYKLCAYGLADCQNVSDRFYDQVLSNEDRVRRLIWLEHRSWQAHLMVNGHLLDPETFEADFVKNKYNHKTGLWHSCLFGSDDTGLPGLENWTLNDWANGDLQPLDPLDRMSVLRHRLLRDRVENHTWPKIAHYTETRLSPYLEKHCPKGSNPLTLFQQTQNVLNMLHDGVPNAEIAWSQLAPRMPQGLCSLVDILLCRNDLRNFKRYDETIIKAIPYLLRSEPIGRIYKLCADHPWQNMASCVFVEPAQWILVTDKAHTLSKSQLNHMLDVLQNRRNIPITATVLPLSKLDAEAPLSGAVLDITGASARQVLEARRHPLLGALPVIAYRRGKLYDLETPGCQIRYYNGKQSLTVEETMAITGTKVLTEKADIPMQGMWEYKTLWNAVQNTTDYYKLCDYLNYKLPQRYSVYPSENTWTTEMPRHIAEAFGLIDLLDRLVEKKLIRPYTRHNVIRVNATGLYFPIRDLLNQLKQAIKNAKTPEKWEFEVLEKGDCWTVRHIATGDYKDLYPRFYTWSSEIPPEKVEGLLELLTQLRRGKVIKSFTWKPHNGWVTTQVIAADKRMQDSLNKLLDGFVSTPPAQRGLLKLRFDSDDPNTLCTLDNLNPTVTETPENPNDPISYYVMGRKAQITHRELVKGLKNLLERGMITAPEGELRNEKTGKICFAYTDLAYRDCLTKTGNALEALVYHTLREMNYFDDVKLGVNVLWDRQDVDGKDTFNEIDVICTKGMQSYFISCKNTTDLNKDYLTEIRYQADRFGVDATAILVCTTEAKRSLTHFARAERMGVKIISLQDSIYRQDMPQDSAQELKRQLRAIVNATE